MRYREGMEAALPYTQVNEGMLIGSAIFGLFAGVLLFIAARYGRQRWLQVWGAGLVISSIAYVGYSLFSGP
ncbi:MAG: hypothetical protein HUJ30_01700 [Gammaproteobacteria bacterium]|nr:hypothetical protein [Gammaproteobacteria bacterium]